ncbi:hypothetical protein [Bradyrhizobium sp. AUGA SZCCT0431]|uniref:hypothetical protein n=1 Tax=Bradyrhizobium sp. AUGA SZCCT0431 TaxID=2807674 RepID=UPI001BAA3045|nr:hypothetical protein [Bradyrhizobium sp. AUGA SZCCT0431]MBR1148762.1 hypothetical protein [Bradyrhizobium sp. AUGA SZCCT0431]
MIDSQQASEALADINEIARRVRQSTIYNLSSQMLIMWGALVFAANMASFLWPRSGAYIWLAVDALGIAGSFAISAYGYPNTKIRAFDMRMFAASLLILAFGIFCCWLGRFTPRQIGTFWPIYFMLFYTIAGLWFGRAYVVIGLGITALTLIGHFFFIDDWFKPWMAVVNGGGLILGGLWMRRE